MRRGNGWNIVGYRSEWNCVEGFRLAARTVWKVYNPTPERLLAWDLVSTIVGSIQQGFVH